MPDAVAALGEFGITLDGIETGTFRGIRFLGDEGAVEAEFPRGRAVGIRRPVLHQKLVQAAQEAGVKLLWGVRVQAVRNGAVLVDGRAVSCRWIVGADGQNSQVRRWAGLNGGRVYERRIGLRQHFAVAPWSEFVEIYWGKRMQAYVTPVGANEVCVAIIAKQAPGSLAAAIADFPALAARLPEGSASTEVRGAVTVTRLLKAVTRGQFALIGDASGSSDAITGEGLAASYRQAMALGHALAAGDLAAYEAAQGQIRALPHFMARAMLLMDKSAWIRDRALRALCAQPDLFRRLLAVHVGELPLRRFAIPGFFNLGWLMLTA